jgi:DNA-binding MurR/RpiR family transcriptional regulator
MEDVLNGFRHRLEEHLPALSKSQRRIADYLLARYDEAAFLSAAQLAERLEVSEATVVRFAQAVGYAGFPDLKRQLQDAYRGQVSPATRLQHKLEELAGHEGHVFTKVIDMEVQYLIEAGHTVVQQDFDRAVEIVLAAHRLWLRGGGPSKVLSDLMELRFRRFGIFATSMTESGRDLVEKLQLLQPGDAVIAVGFVRVSAELNAVIEHARRVGCPVVLITDTLGGALRSRVDVVLAARRGPVSTFHSLSVPMAIANALILAVALARPADSLAALENMQRMRTGYWLDGPVRAPQE